MEKASKNVFVAMSGGVDSSVAAALLLRQGYGVVGVHMRCYNVDGCAEQDAEDARRAAEVLGIPFYVFDFEKEYKKRVVEYMVDGYRRGLTPNPDVECNREIKFGLFLKKALEMGADYVATGHYVILRHTPMRTGGSPAPAAGARLRSRRDGSSARLRDQARRGSESFSTEHAGVYRLFIGSDRNKDQSYFLWTLTQYQLRHCLFPIGGYKKPEVRKLARKFGLLNADKKDSQGICFLGKVQLADFLKGYIPENRGMVLNTAGEAVGEHRGAQFYTIGQRHIGVSATWDKRHATRGDSKPFYVAEKNVKKNTLVVAEGNDNTALYRKEIELRAVNFIRPLTIDRLPLTVYARVRYRQPLAKTMLVKSTMENEKSNRKSIIHYPFSFKLLFERPQKAVAPGQSAVFYIGNTSSVSGSKSKDFEMLGGGVIV